MSGSPRRLRFEDFEFDCRSGELFRGAERVKLRPQAARLLRLLASRAGEVVTRPEIRRALWDDATFVDFEHGVNFQVTQLRKALGDHASRPRFIETLPRIGYRFCARVAEATAERRSWALGWWRRGLRVLAALPIPLLLASLRKP